MLLRGGVRFVAAASVVGAATLFSGCGGGGGGGGENAEPPAAPTVTLSANPSSVVTGGASMLTWSSANASGCTASGAWSGTRASSGSASTGALSATSSYVLECSGPGGSASASTTVTVTTTPPIPPTVSLTASPSSVAVGGSSTLTWSSTNASGCTASDAWSGNLPTSGSMTTGALNATSIYTLSCTGTGGTATATVTVTVAAGGTIYGLEWPGNGAIRRMLYWHDPFPIYDATYVFRVFPRKKTVPPFPNGYYTTFFWGNDGIFTWDNGGTYANTYYGAHPYPIPAPNGAGQWEISVYSGDAVTGTEVGWNRWYVQAFRAWRESPAVTHHEFYWDLPDTSKVIRIRVDDADWAAVNPPTPAIVIGQAPGDDNGYSWGGYAGWEEFNGVIRGIQMYSGLLSVNDILAEIATPLSTNAGRSLIWYLNLNPRPGDVTDKKGTGTPHNPSWRGTTALEWSE